MSNPTSIAARFAALVFSLAFGALSIVPLAAQAQAASAPEAAVTPAPVAVDASAPAVAAPMAAAPVSKETVENPYSLGHTISAGDWVSRGTLLILTLMSMGSWYILVTKLYESLQMSREAKQVTGKFFKAKSVGDASKSLKAGTAFRFIADSGLEASEHHEGALTENIDHNSWVSMKVQRAIDDVNGRLQDGLAFLATVGSTAPFIGLFGTVWGIYNALTAIGIAGQASIDKVAGPVGEALIMTAFGLFVAVPAVLGYNWLVRRNKVTMESVRRFGADLHGVLMGARMGATPTAR
jgi:biopolymer transport protein ExbB